MRHTCSLVSSSARALSVALFASMIPASAAAHIELVEPAPRYTVESNKSCPCGDGDSNRRCMVTAEESSDPNRSANVHTFEAGDTIHIVVDEYIDHAGRIRIAFDDDGADLADFNETILMDVSDPAEPGLSTANPRVWEFDVTLPNMTCDNCTLQVIQAMHGDTDNPVLDPAPLSTYYTCADLRLVPEGSLEADGSGDNAGSGGSANAGVAGGPSAGGAAGSAGANQPAAGNGGSGGAAAGSVSDGDDADAEEDSGCALGAGTGSNVAGWSLALLGLAALVRRRRS